MDISYQTIERELQAEDIEGFLEAGAPSDEYVSEAKEIAKFLMKIGESERSEDNVAIIISRVWAKSFDLSKQDMTLRRSAIQRLARRLVK